MRISNPFLCREGGITHPHTQKGQLHFKLNTWDALIQTHVHCTHTCTLLYHDTGAQIREEYWLFLPSKKKQNPLLSMDLCGAGIYRLNVSLWVFHDSASLHLTLRCSTQQNPEHDVSCITPPPSSCGGKLNNLKQPQWKKHLTSSCCVIYIYLYTHSTLQRLLLQIFHF